jgi:DNA replication protein DnaC
VAPAARAAFLAAVRHKTPWPVYFYGLQGRGKSTAALWFLDHCVRGVYLTAREIVDIEFGGDWAMKQRLRESWSRADLCVIDQFGMCGKQGPSQTQVLVDAIDKREGRPLILVSNIATHDLSEVYDAQIQSRVAAGTSVEFVGLDHRTHRSTRTGGGRA